MGYKITKCGSKWAVCNGDKFAYFFNTRRQAREFVKKNKPKEVTPAQMKTGEYGVIVAWSDKRYINEVVCKAYGDWLISISRPKNTWNSCHRLQDTCFKIRIITRSQAGEMLAKLCEI